MNMTDHFLLFKDPEGLCVILTLPQLTPDLKAHLQKGTLRDRNNYNAFVRLMADHLVTIAPRRSKSIYSDYARSIVQQYPIFKDPTSIGQSNWVKTRLLFCFFVVYPLSK